MNEEELRAYLMKKVEDSRVEIKDDWSDGFNTALDWVLRILRKDKSAT